MSASDRSGTVRAASSATVTRAFTARCEEPYRRAANQAAEPDTVRTM